MLALVLVADVLIHSESVRRQLPVIATAELQFHALLTKFAIGQRTVPQLVLIDVDDRAFWSDPVAGTIPVNRRFIADLARHAADAGARIIAIDFPIRSPYSTPGDSASRYDANAYLLDTVRKLGARGIPVILTASVVFEGGNWHELPNIFPDTDWGPGASVGASNLDPDPREIPLRRMVIPWNGVAPVPMDSFGLAITDEYQRASALAPLTSESRVIARALRRHEFVYGGFIPISSFRRVGASDLIRDAPDAMRACRNRVALIGGTWHTLGPGRGTVFDSHPSPVGTIPRVYLDANYAAALIDGRFQAALPLWLTLLIDFLGGMLLYSIYHGLDDTAFALALSGFVSALGIVAYILFANLGWYLDFVPLLLAIFIHLSYEHAHSYILIRRTDAAGIGDR